MPTPALVLTEISKRYGDVVALDHVDLTVTAGSVHAVLGENGAGKTTLMRVAYGLTRADSGAVRFFDTPVSAPSVRASMRAGIGMVHQHLSLVPSLSAAENFSLGNPGLYRPRGAAARLRELSRAFGLHVRDDAIARDLSVVEQQRLEILKALGRNARVLILDEPSAVLAPAEVGELLQWIRRFASTGGSVAIVTHRLREAITVADHVTVLRHGRVAYSGPTAETTESELARAILGGGSVDVAAASVPVVAPGEPIVMADKVCLTDQRGIARIQGASFEMRRHEIIGIAAAEGAGQRELLLALAGLERPRRGEMRLPSGIAIVPADRHRDAVILDFTLTENVVLGRLGGRRGLIDWGAEFRRTAELLQRFSIAAASPSAPARSLSGGNQQRLVMARELEQPNDLVVAINPTRGLDIRAAAFVHARLREVAARGATVVIHASDLDEVLSIATRVFVVYGGTVREMPNDRDAVGRAMLGAA